MGGTINLQYSANGEENDLVFKTNHILLIHLQKIYPSLLRENIDALRQDDSQEIDKMKGSNKVFKDWLYFNYTNIVMEKVNKKGRFYYRAVSRVFAALEGIRYQIAVELHYLPGMINLYVVCQPLDRSAS